LPSDVSEASLNDSNVEKDIPGEALVRVLALKELGEVLKFLEDTTLVLFLPSNGLFLAVCRMDDDLPCVLTILLLVEHVQRSSTPYDSHVEYALCVARKSETEVEQAMRTILVVDDRVQGIMWRQMAPSEGGKSRDLLRDAEKHRSDISLL
jgi:hypothetical protein